MARHALGTLAATLAVLAGTMAAASAAEADLTVRAERDVRTAESFRIHVPYGDLDLAEARGVAILRDRVRAAAHDGCAGLYAGEGLPGTLRVRGLCVHGSSRAAMAQVDEAIRLAQAGQDPGSQVALLIRK